MTQDVSVLSLTAAQLAEATVGGVEFRKIDLASFAS